jgi:hypothetical protein
MKKPKPKTKLAKPKGASVSDADISTLDREIKTSLATLSSLTREGRRVLKDQLLPALQEIKARLRRGAVTVDGRKYSTLGAYLHSIGLNASIVRNWEFRSRPVKTFLVTSMEQEAQRRHTEEDRKRQAKEEKIDATPEGKKAVEGRAEVRQKEAKTRQKEEETGAQEEQEEQEPSIINFDDLPSTTPAILLLVKRIIDVGFKTLTHRIHPDLGGDDREMQNLNAARKWIAAALKLGGIIDAEEAA